MSEGNQGETMSTPHCDNCDPSFLECWNDGDKCRKAAKRQKMFPRKVKLTECENCFQFTMSPDGLCMQCGYSQRVGETKKSPISPAREAAEKEVSDFFSKCLHYEPGIHVQTAISSAVAEVTRERDEARAQRDAFARPDTELTMGVGDGSGSLFVHGSYESIKAAQAIVLERDSLRCELEQEKAKCANALANLSYADEKIIELQSYINGYIGEGK